MGAVNANDRYKENLRVEIPALDNLGYFL